MPAYFLLHALSTCLIYVPAYLRGIILLRSSLVGSQRWPGVDGIAFNLKLLVQPLKQAAPLASCYEIESLHMINSRETGETS